MIDYSARSLIELIEVITTWPVGMPVRARLLGSNRMTLFVPLKRLAFFYRGASGIPQIGS
jgi:hypothetical protein